MDVFQGSVFRCSACHASLSLIKGLRWQCDVCSNYYMCSSCFINKKWNHDKSHSFHKIHSKSNPEDKAEVNKPTVPIKQEKLDLDTSNDRIKCDTCSQCPIEGISWKCNDCIGYNLCSSCHEVFKFAHAKSHTFTKMEAPKTQTSPAAGPSTSATQPGPPIKDRVECSICSLEISKENTDCEHFHICSTCHNKYRSTNTLKRKYPAEIIKGYNPGVDAGPSTPKKATGVPAKCETCNECPIKGVRWKSNECANFYFCTTCYEKNSKMHAPLHTFKKMRGKKIQKDATGSQGTPHNEPPITSKLPSNWKHMKKLESVKKVTSPRSSEEFKLLKTNFLKTMGNNKIIKVERIQSKLLWPTFYEKREQMERINGPIGANEMHLFHGTKEELLEGICRNNIDARQAGTHVGGILGNGIYFSKEATYADRRAPRDPKTGHRFMLQCRVLVGMYSKGKKGSKGPPELKDGSGRLHDSCVDDINNPFLFCLFDKDQCYPEYIIEYQ